MDFGVRSFCYILGFVPRGSALLLFMTIVRHEIPIPNILFFDFPTIIFVHCKAKKPPVKRQHCPLNVLVNTLECLG